MNNTTGDNANREGLRLKHVDGCNEVLDTCSRQHRVMLEEQHIFDAVIAKELLEADGVSRTNAAIGLLVQGHTTFATSLERAVLAAVVDDQGPFRVHRLTFKTIENLVEGVARVMRQDRYSKPRFNRHPRFD